MYKYNIKYLKQNFLLLIYCLKNFTINYWIEKGGNSRQIVLGFPLYGQSFTLSNPDVHGLNAPSSGPGEAGPFTRSAGFIAYYEVHVIAKSFSCCHYYFKYLCHRYIDL